MNIFKNRDKALSDDLPGREAMPRPRLPPVEEQLGEMVRERFAPQPLTLDKRRERLDYHLGEFAMHHDAARREATAYLEEHDAMIRELESEKAKIQDHLATLDKIAAGMPAFGGKDEKDHSDDNPGDNGNASPGQTVPIKPIEGFNKPLPLNRR